MLQNFTFFLKFVAPEWGQRVYEINSHHRNEYSMSKYKYRKIVKYEYFMK